MLMLMLVLMLSIHVHRRSRMRQFSRVSQFCFPVGQHHCRSTGRLIVFSLYGPFDDKGRLCCGIRGKHVVADYELKTMIDDIELEDILEVYVVRSPPPSHRIQHTYTTDIHT
jgi:hypothetical protein